jgi:hypothetical protein
VGASPGAHRLGPTRRVVDQETLGIDHQHSEERRLGLRISVCFSEVIETFFFYFGRFYSIRNTFLLVNEAALKISNLNETK